MVQVDVWPIGREAGEQVIVVVVTWPAVTVVVPVSVSSVKKPLQAVVEVLPEPGAQSLVADPGLGLAFVSVCRPMSAPDGLNANSGKAASIESLSPFAHEEVPGVG